MITTVIIIGTQVGKCTARLSFELPLALVEKELYM